MNKYIKKMKKNICWLITSLHPLIQHKKNPVVRW